ncbi:MAG: T9SS type A sorting domain-containing protein [Ignavibacteriae bacterium]|nr:T9SS type A sorting domain-containing protein [Ignavibacteriota bacterium]
MRRIVLICVLLLLCSDFPLHAQWSTNPTTNTPICTAERGQSGPRIISDGAEGAIVTWNDGRNGTDVDIYAQKVDASGVVEWQLDGIPISTAAYTQYNPAIVSDGAGGAIITWDDSRSGSNRDIYAQKVNASGAVQWQVEGVPICTEASDQGGPAIVTDNTGGAIITWSVDYRGTDWDIYAQKIDGAGVAQWTADGVPICLAPASQVDANIISDGAGGAILVWNDVRNDTYDIYAQRVNALGDVQWTVNGILVKTSAGGQQFLAMVSDGAGGAIIAWHDSADIYAQRVNASGEIEWQTDGVPICTATGNQGSPGIISDDAGGAIFMWGDFRSGTNNHIYAQKVNSSGVVQWQVDGVPIATADWENGAMIVSDDVGGAIITWYDTRNGSNDIYAQRVNASGVIEWQSGGVPISTASNNQQLSVIVSDGAGGAIITWQDYRSGTDYDIYAQRVLADGTLGNVTGLFDETHSLPERFELEQNYPNPFNPSTTFNFQLPTESFVTLKVYDVLGREVATLVNEKKDPGVHTVTWNAEKMSSGIYTYRITAGTFTAAKKLILLR